MDCHSDLGIFWYCSMLYHADICFKDTNLLQAGIILSLEPVFFSTLPLYFGELLTMKGYRSSFIAKCYKCYLAEHSYNSIFIFWNYIKHVHSKTVVHITIETYSF